MYAAEIVIHEPKRHRCGVVPYLLGESIREAGETANAHPLVLARACFCFFEVSKLSSVLIPPIAGLAQKVYSRNWWTPWRRKSKTQNQSQFLRLKIDGPGMRKGRVPIPELILVCKEAQNAINKQAEVLRKRNTIHPGPIAHSIQDECTLELIGIHGNSPTTLDFDLRKPQRALAFNEELGATAIREVANTIAGLRKKSVDGFDPGVLLRLYWLTGAINPKLIKRIDWITPSRNGHGPKLQRPLQKQLGSASPSS
jgi:hypothetical protein